MKLFINYIVLIAVVLSLSCCRNEPKSGSETEIIDGHPAWIMQGNIYKVNVRQYTTEGTFSAFAKHLGRLKTIWFMPINPISTVYEYSKN